MNQILLSRTYEFETDRKLITFFRYRIKKGTFRFLINKAFRISSTENLRGELDKIKLITTNNGYHVKLVNKLIQNFINKMKTGVIGNKTDCQLI